VHPDLPVKNLTEFIAYAKSKPGQLNYGSAGTGRAGHLAFEYLKLVSGTFMLHVPYRGTAGYTQDLLAGEVQAGFLPVHVAAGFVKSGRLVALAVGSQKRHPVAADVPTFAEVGIQRIDVDLWYAFYAPSKTPPAVVARLNTEISAIVRQNDVKEMLARAGMDASTSTPAELAALVAKDYPRWGNVIRSKQISAD
jgi:tripartite-type tricarboxylate transporter receptor subunit TctC